MNRPLVAFSALGKSGFFAVVLACWLLGDVPALTLFAAGGDLAFAALFAWWLLATAGRPTV